MITRAFLHYHGIGPVKLDRLRRQGVCDWDTVLTHPDRLPFKGKLAVELVDQVRGCRAALERDDIGYLVRQFHSRDQWRILGHYFSEASFFDIETTGLDWMDTISMIVCYHRGRLYRFYDGENLEEFLALLDDMRLLVSFNGASFDVPRVLDAFRVPELPCPHIDMRWLCYHSEYTGGLKAIADHMALRRPADLDGLTGFEAVALWDRWTAYGDRRAKRQLTRYCCADVILLVQIAAGALAKKGVAVDTADSEDLWSLLPD